MKIYKEDERFILTSLNHKSKTVKLILDDFSFELLVKSCDDLIEIDIPKKFLNNNTYLAIIQILDDDRVVLDSCNIEFKHYLYDYYFDKIGDSLIFWLVRNSSKSPTLLIELDGLKLYVAPDKYRNDVNEKYNYPVISGYEIPNPKLASEIKIIDIEKENLVLTLIRYNKFDFLQKKIQYKKLGYLTEINKDDLLAINGSHINSYGYKVNTKIKDINEYIYIIIPVYAGLKQTTACILSVLNAKNNSLFKIIIVNDNTKDSAIYNYINGIDAENLILIDKKSNTGFPDTINLAVKFVGGHDFIILNSDTVVTDYWIDKILSISESDQTIGTITPITNNGELVSSPLLGAITNPSFEQVQKINSYCEEFYSGEYFDIPVGNGFCLFIRNACWHEAGGFDAELWGKGYGEEIDFCIKASQMGWRNVCTYGTYIYHEGGVSFGANKAHNIRENSKKILELYPSYDEIINYNFQTSKLNEINKEIILMLISEVKVKNFEIHISHSLGGGTEKFVSEISKKASIVINFDSNKNSTFNFIEMDGLLKKLIYKFDASDINTMLRSLGYIKDCKYIIHSTIYVPIELLNFLENKSYESVIHDYSWICPRVHMTNNDGIFCNNEKSDSNCDKCIKNNGAHPGLVDLYNGNGISTYRALHQKILKSSTAIAIATNDSRVRINEYYPLENFELKYFPKDDLKKIKYEDLSRSEYLNIGLIGGVSTIKGYKKLKELSDYCFINNLKIKFFVIGFTEDDSLINKKNIFIFGKYLEKDIFSIINSFDIDVFWFPNQCPETFSYTLSHAMKTGKRIVCTDLGAPKIRLNKYQLATLYDPSSPPKELIDIFMNLK